MSGYKFNRVEQAANNSNNGNNDGEPIIDGGNSLTNYLVQFDNGSANNSQQTNPVVLNFGGAT